MIDTSPEAVERVARVLSVGPTVATPTDLAEAAALLRALVGERRDTARFDWFFGDSDKLPFMSNYMLGLREGWTPAQWRSSIDAAIAATLQTETGGKR